MDQTYLIFDIETIPVNLDFLSESQQEYITRNAQTDEEREKKLGEMALTPLTAHVVCIGLQLMQTENGIDYELKKRAAFSVDMSFDDDRQEQITLRTGEECYLCSERKVLENFWKILVKYNNPHLISFNGRNFDAPFLMLRSALLKVKPSKNLMLGTKFNYQNHTDLIDELTFYNPSAYGATKRFNFDFYTRAFGITSPKGEGIDGSKVSTFFKEGKIAEISEYCLRDVKATWELFLIWKEFLRF